MTSAERNGPSNQRGAIVPAVGNVVVFVADLSMQQPLAPAVEVRLRRMVTGAPEKRTL